jgi:protein ImuA
MLHPIHQAPEPAPAGKGGRDAGPERLGRLRAAIRAIEGASALPPAPILDTGGGASGAAAWTLGEPALDDLIGPAGLDAGGVHEIKPALPGAAATGGCDWMAASAAARRFALMLAARRLATCEAPWREAPVLWCASAGEAAELGRPYGPGLGALGLDPRRLILVEPAKAADALWVLDEGLKSGALALVLGQVRTIDLTPARRLALAAGGTRTPCLLLTDPRAPAAAATTTRWRIGPAPGAANRLDPRAPGAARFRISLERCRGSPAAGAPISLVLEWCDAAFRFRLAADVAAGASGTGKPQSRQAGTFWGDAGSRRVAGMGG